MAYTNAIFYMDMVSGSDAVRSTLTACTASNPSGTITRLNKTAHGLVTGAVVTTSNFTAWLNGTWKITVVDANNFDLDTAVWQATADATGDVVPFGGSSWADAWKFPVTGPTAARTQPGDVIRVAESEAEVSLGQNATWTSGSQDVVLTTAVTKNIEDGITGFTASTNVTASTNASRKFGATSQNLAFAAGFTTGKAAYKAISGGGTQDFSAYSKISLWFYTSAITAASDYSIVLCSDTLGATPVDTLNIPACPVAAQWYPIVIDKGSALGSSIQSVAVYANVDPGTANIRINNIVACGDLTHQVLIGKTGEVEYAIQSINGTTIKIDSASTTASGRGYYGTTETVTTYRKDPIQLTANSGIHYTLPEGGSATSGYIEYQFGYNTSTSLQTGFTWLDGSIAQGSLFLINALSFIKISNVGIVRFAYITSLGNAIKVTLENVRMICSSGGISSSQSFQIKINNSKILNNGGTATAVIGARVLWTSCSFLNSTGSGISAAGGNEFRDCIFANNGTIDIAVNEGNKFGTGSLLLRKCQLLSTSEFSFSANRDGYVWSFDHDNVAGSNKGFAEGGTWEWQTTTFHASEPGSWKGVCTSTTRSSIYPLTLPLGPFAVNSGSLVTLKVWVKKDHATNVSASFYVDGTSLSGVSATSVTKASDTSWEELTLTFTPTEKGAIMSYVDVWCTSITSANVYVGTVTLTQA